MDKVRWKLKDYLDEHGITPYRLAEHTHGHVSRTGIYRLAASDLKGIRFESLAAVLPALREITGEEVTIADLIEHEPAEAPPEADWMALADSFDDPDWPEDFSARHDDYLAEALEEEHRESLAGER